MRLAAGKWLGNGWEMAGKWLANGWQREWLPLVDASRTVRARLQHLLDNHKRAAPPLLVQNSD